MDDSKYKLMPCPFCGAYACYIHYKISMMWSVQCTDCSVQSADCATQDHATSLWNKRVKIYHNEEDGELNIFHPRDPYVKRTRDNQIDNRPKRLDLSHFNKPASNSDDNFMRQPTRKKH